MPVALVVGPPIMTELGPPQTGAGGHVPDATLRGPQDLAKEIVVLGRSNVADLASYPIGEVPVAVPGLELVHGGFCVQSRKSSVAAGGVREGGASHRRGNGTMLLLLPAGLVRIVGYEGAPSPVSIGGPPFQRRGSWWPMVEMARGAGVVSPAQRGARPAQPHRGRASVAPATPRQGSPGPWCGLIGSDRARGGRGPVSATINGPKHRHRSSRAHSRARPRSSPRSA